MAANISSLIDRLIQDPGALDAVMQDPTMGTAQLKQLRDLAMFISRHTLDEIRALADSGELQKWLPAVELPPDCSAPLEEEVKLLDRRSFARKA